VDEPLDSEIARRRAIYEQAAYLGARSPGKEEDFLESAGQSFLRWLQLPEIGELFKTNNDRLAGMRMGRINGFPKHVVCYRGVGEAIEIVRVLHRARNIAAIFDERK
jgi:toxin ParE1/3/4